MGIEVATYISDLDPLNPLHTDGLNNADAHIRLIKETEQNTFPNITGAVTATHTQLNALAGGILDTSGLVTVPQQSSTVGGAIVLTGANATAGKAQLLNSASALAVGAASLTLWDAAQANPHVVVSAAYTGAVSALLSFDAPTIKQGGNTLLPAGCIVLWAGSVLAIPAGWQLCDGTNGTPNLTDRFVVGAGSSYSPTATGGATVVSATSSSNGAHTHGGATASGGGQTLAGSADSQGDHAHGAATGSTAISIAQMPAHTHDISATNAGSIGGANPLAGSSALSTSYATASQGSGQGHTHSVASDGTHTHNITVQSVSAHAHTITSDGAHTHTVSGSILPPYYALCYIYKL